MGKRVNPRRVPCTKADVERAKEDATLRATEAAMAILFTALLDKYGWEKEQLKDLFAQIESISDSLEKGYITIADLIHTLRVDYEIELR